MRKLSLGDATALVSPPRYERWRCILIQEHCTGTTSRTPTIVTSYILLFLGLSHQLLARCTFIYLFLIAAKVHLCLGSIPTSASSQSSMWSAGHWMHDLRPSLRPWHTVRLSSLATVTFVLFHPQSRCRSTFTCSFWMEKIPSILLIIPTFWILTQSFPPITLSSPSWDVKNIRSMQEILEPQ